ncbi:MAG TPA: mucoidy inhibitor MuiA family protein [Polyangia bacterium]|nr:mucoidy inhibitor MuiA family protein [Polyangia bacterium]
MLYWILMVAMAPPTISQVVVYPDRAQVTRAQSIECGGQKVVRFGAIPPAADPASFRAVASAGAVEGLRYEEHTLAEAYAPEVKQLETETRKLSALVAAERDRQRRASSSTTLASSYTDVAVARVGREMTEPQPSVKAWSSAFEGALAARQKAALQHVAAQARIRELDHQLDDLSRRRARLAESAARREYLAEVLVACPVGQSARVELTYLVGGASWQPAYEARADESEGAVDLSTFALVRQSTGENWTQAKVVLSTAVPRQDATPPELQPLQLWAEERSPERKVLVRREEYHEHSESSGETSKPAATPGPKDGRMQVAEQGLSVQLSVPEPADIAGNDTPARLFVGTTHLKAKFALRAVPKMMPFAFRVADLENSAPYPLLPGALDAFRKNGMIARYQLERVAEGEPFHLTFGVDDAVRVKRVVLQEVQRDAGFLGSTRRFWFQYRYELANYQSRDQELEISDHVPVSELKDVKVYIDAKTTGGYDNRAEDGIVTWRLKLKAGEKRNVELAFHIDAPSSYDSGSM